jgi:hypothetical protein
MQITVTIREIYGIKTVYPVCITAKVFASIAGTKTLTLATLKKIEAWVIPSCNKLSRSRSERLHHAIQKNYCFDSKF